MKQSSTTTKSAGNNPALSIYVPCALCAPVGAHRIGDCKLTRPPLRVRCGASCARGGGYARQRRRRSDALHRAAAPADVSDLGTGSAITRRITGSHRGKSSPAPPRARYYARSSRPRPACVCARALCACRHFFAGKNFSPCVRAPPRPAARPQTSAIGRRGGTSPTVRPLCARRSA